MDFYNCGLSPLIDDSIKKELTRVFKKLHKKVILAAILVKKSSKSLELAQLLNTIASLCPDIEIQYFLSDERPELEHSLQNEGHYPVFGIFDQDFNYSGLSYLGIPGGKELNSFVYGLYNWAGAGQPISKKNLTRLEKIQSAHTIKIYVSLNCHYCCNTVIACQLLSSKNPLISSQMIDAALFPDLIEKYKIERIPLIIVDDNKFLWGEKTIDDLLTVLESV